MSHRTLINRADLLECLAHDEAHLDGLAAALGYVRREPPPMSKPPPRRVAPEPLPPPEPGQPTVTAAPSQARFHRVVAQRRLEPGEIERNVPAWFQQAEPFRSEEEIRAPAGLTPPPREPLMRWSRLWPFLKMALSVQQTTRALDILRIVAQLARVQTLRRLPRRQRRLWAADCQLIVDYARPLLPFWEDFNDLLQRLRRLRGQTGLQLIALPDGDPSGRCWTPAGQEWREIDHYPLPRPGAAVLALSDLGCIDTNEARRRQWRRLGRRLQRLERRPVALLPCPSRWWDSELLRLFYPVCWDRAEHPPRRLSVRRIAPAERSEADPGADRLLALLAPALRVEPALLRAARCLLPAWQCDVGGEAAAWNHRHVHPTPLAFYYDSEFIADYRRRFQAEEETVRRQLADLIIAYHAPLSPAIGQEERLVLAQLENACDPQAQQFMERIVKTLHTPDSALAASVRHWAQRLTRRQYDVIGQNEVLAIAWATVKSPESEAPPGLDLRRVGWLLALGQMSRRYTLRQRGQVLYLETDAVTVTDGELGASGSPVGEISAAAPYVQWQRLAVDGSILDERLQSLQQAIALHPDDVLRLHTDQQELTIDSLPRPDWAEEIGRDDYGLYADCRINKVVQRLRWITPGEFLMGSPENEAERYDNELQHRVILTQGFWLADTACTQALWKAVMGDNPSRFKGDERPVETVSWEQIQQLIERLNELTPGGGFRLPTEAEWEYACRAGTTTPFWFGVQITPDQVNYDGNFPYAGGPKGQYRRETVEVKALPCNSWGLYQMHGNVWEWCQDWYGEYPSHTVTDPVGLGAGADRVIRGGSWLHLARDVRAASRFQFGPVNRLDSLGFRCARVQS